MRCGRALSPSRSPFFFAKRPPLRPLAAAVRPGVHGWGQLGADIANLVLNKAASKCNFQDNGTWRQANLAAALVALVGNFSMPWATWGRHWRHLGATSSLINQEMCLRQVRGACNPADMHPHVAGQTGWL